MANPRNQKNIDKVLDLRTKGLSYRQINKLTGIDFKTIYLILRHYVQDPMRVDNSGKTVLTR